MLELHHENGKLNIRQETISSSWYTTADAQEDLPRVRVGRVAAHLMINSPILVKGTSSVSRRKRGKKTRTIHGFLFELSECRRDGKLSKFLIFIFLTTGKCFGGKKRGIFLGIRKNRKNPTVRWCRVWC